MNTSTLRRLMMAAAVFVLAGCGAISPLNGTSVSASGVLGSLSVERRPVDRPALPDYLLACGTDTACQNRVQSAERLSCTAALAPSAYALCLRCIRESQPDADECKRMAMALVGNSTQIVGTQVFVADGTQDPAIHPPIGPMPPLQNGARESPLKKSR